MAENSRALPDLVSRARIDRSQWITDKNAITNDLQSMRQAAGGAGTGLDALGAAHGKAGAAAKSHSSEVNRLESAVKDADRVVGIFERTMGSLGIAGESGIGRAASQLAGATGGLGPLGEAAGVGLGATAAIGGVVYGLDKMAEGQAKLAARVLSTSAAIGVQSGELQGLEKWGERYNIQAETMDQQLFVFNKNLGENAPLLAKQGLSLDELGIKSKDTYQAYLQTADAINRISDSEQRAVIVQALFGKGGEAQLQALQQGSAVIDQYNQKLRDYGVILDDNTLKAGAQAAAAREDLGLALEGLKNEFVAPLERGFITLDIAVTKMAENGKGAMHGFGEAMSVAVSDLASLLNGLFGLGLTQAKLDEASAQQAKDASVNQGAVQAAYAKTATAAKDYQQEILDLRRSTQDHVQEINDEVRAETEKQAAYDKSIAQAIQVETELQRQLDLTVQLRNEQRTAAADQAAVAKTTSEITKATFFGDFAANVTLGEQLTTEKQKQSDDQLRFGVDAQKRESQARIDAYTDQKNKYDEVAKDHITKLNDQARAEQQAATDQEQRLQDLLNASKNTANGASDAFQTSATKGTIAFSGMTLTLNDRFTKLGQDISAALRDPFSPANMAALSDDAHTLGSAMGSALMDGMGIGMYKDNPTLARMIFGDAGIRKIQTDIQVNDQKAQADKVTQAMQAPPPAISAGQFDPATGNTVYNVGPAPTYASPSGSNVTGDRYYASGGILTEPVIGFGQRTGTRYHLAEDGPEEVRKPGQTSGSAATAGAAVIEQHFHFENYIGSRSDVMTWVQQAVASTQMHA